MARYRKPTKHTYPKPKGGKDAVNVHPRHPDPRELIEAAWGLTDRNRYLLRLMFGEKGGTIDAGKLQWLEHVFADPESAVNVPQYRPYVAAVLRKFLDWVNTDQQLFTRAMTLAQRAKAVRTGVSELTDTAEISTTPAWEKTLRKYAADGTLAEACKARKPFDLNGFKTKIASGLKAKGLHEGPAMADVMQRGDEYFRNYDKRAPWHWSDLLTGSSVRRTPQKDSTMGGNKLRSTLRGMLGIPDDPSQPAPWQPGGEWHKDEE